MSGPIDATPVNNSNNSALPPNEKPSLTNAEEKVAEVAQVAVKPTEDFSSTPVTGKRKRERCNFPDCKRKITIVSRFECSGCNEVLGKVVAYCSKHRLASEHNCTFDYRKAQQEKLRKENPRVVANKNPGWDL